MRTILTAGPLEEWLSHRDCQLALRHGNQLRMNAARRAYPLLSEGFHNLLLQAQVRASSEGPHAHWDSFRATFQNPFTNGLNRVHQYQRLQCPSCASDSYSTRWNKGDLEERLVFTNECYIRFLSHI